MLISCKATTVGLHNLFSIFFKKSFAKCPKRPYPPLSFLYTANISLLNGRALSFPFIMLIFTRFTWGANAPYTKMTRFADKFGLPLIEIIRD